MRWRIGLKLLIAFVMLFVVGILSGAAIHNILLRTLFNILAGGIIGIGTAKMLTGASWKEIYEAWRFWGK